MKNIYILSSLLYGILSLTHTSYAQPTHEELCQEYITKKSEIDRVTQDSSWDTLYKNYDYQAILNKYKFMLHQGTANQQALAYANEAIFSLGELKANNRDPQKSRNMLYIDDGGKSDPLGYKLWQISVNIGPNEWK